MLFPNVPKGATKEEIIQAYVDQLGWSPEEARAYLEAAMTEKIIV